MQRGYEGLDRPGGFSRVRLLAPLGHREFRLLWGGTCVSLVGDGMFLVVLAWQVYSLSGAPSALATVGIAMTVPTIGCLLLGGALSDRFDRRRVMLAADCVRGAAVGLLALLSVAGSLRLWQIVALGTIYGAATAFFDPCFDAIVPDLLPASDLAQANSLDQLIRPIALRMAGPALAGVLIQIIGADGAFGLDAVSFAVSAGALLALRPPGLPASRTESSVGQEILTGLRYVRGCAWLWATFASAAIAYLLFAGPTEVLLPFIVKDQLRGGAEDLGLIFAVGGLGSLLCAIVVGQRGLPRHEITFIYIVWTLATFALVGFGLSHALWGLMLTSLLFNSLETIGTITWATVKQRHVPGALLGRVSSLDWLISIALLPLSFALTGPVSGAIGVSATLIGAGVLGGLVTFGALFVPGVRAIESVPEVLSRSAREVVGRVDPLGQPRVRKASDAAAFRQSSRARTRSGSLTSLQHTVNRRLSEACAALDAPSRALLDLWLRQGLSDDAVAKMAGLELDAVASRRLGIIDRLSAGLAVPSNNVLAALNEIAVAARECPPMDACPEPNGRSLGAFPAEGMAAEGRPGRAIPT